MSEAIVLGILLNGLLGMMGEVAVQQLVRIDLHQVQHGQGLGVLVDLQSSNVTLLNTVNCED